MFGRRLAAKARLLRIASPLRTVVFFLHAELLTGRRLLFFGLLDFLAHQTKEVNFFGIS